MTKSILVGDVGSTKSTWWHNAGALAEVHLHGYNPIAHSAESGLRLFESLKSLTGECPFSEIWYYGAGITDQSTADKVYQQLIGFFPQSQIHISSDLAGAASAACGSKPGAVAILGTGSHAAIWDGKRILRQATSLGYILGDEGGGCDIGKLLIQSYFYQEMPNVISAVMRDRLPSGRSGFFEEFRASVSPNQYLADFAKVAVTFQEHPWVTSLIVSRFKLFVKRHLVPLDPPGQVHIVGSIGCIFASLIKQELEKNGLTPGSFIQDPSQGMFERHLENG